MIALDCVVMLVRDISSLRTCRARTQSRSSLLSILGGSCNLRLGVLKTLHLLLSFYRLLVSTAVVTVSSSTPGDTKPFNPRHVLGWINTLVYFLRNIVYARA
jgi:hypothetical protein